MGPPTPLILGKKEEISRASKSPPAPSSIAQGLDLLVQYYSVLKSIKSNMCWNSIPSRDLPYATETGVPHRAMNQLGYFTCPDWSLVG